MKMLKTKNIGFRVIAGILSLVICLNTVFTTNLVVYAEEVPGVETNATRTYNETEVTEGQDYPSTSVGNTLPVGIVPENAVLLPNGTDEENEFAEETTRVESSGYYESRRVWVADYYEKKLVLEPAVVETKIVYIPAHTKLVTKVIPAHSEVVTIPSTTAYREVTTPGYWKTVNKITPGYYRYGKKYIPPRTTRVRIRTGSGYRYVIKRIPGYYKKTKTWVPAKPISVRVYVKAETTSVPYTIPSRTKLVEVPEKTETVLEYVQEEKKEVEVVVRPEKWVEKEVHIPGHYENRNVWIPSFGETDESVSQTPDFSQFTIGDKDNTIIAYEETNPEAKTNMDKLLKPLLDAGYDADIREIKFLTYTADDPYRSTFIHYAKDMVITTLNHPVTEPQNYNSTTKEISFCISKWKGNYNTFFHECGHAIDDLLKTDHSSGDSNSKYASTTFLNMDGNSLMDLEWRDVQNMIFKFVELLLPTITSATLSAIDMITAKSMIANVIMNCASSINYTPFFLMSEFSNQDITPKDMMDCYYEVIKSIKAMGTGTSIAASDIYGGFSGNLLRILRGHSVANPKRVYWIEGTYDIATKVLTPTYNENGCVIYKGSQAKELFAETFAAYMTADEKEINEIKSHFPTAVTLIEDILDAR